MTMCFVAMIGGKAGERQECFYKHYRKPGTDQKQEFQKNVDAVARVLATAPAGARITVLGITDRSFSNPPFSSPPNYPTTQATSGNGSSRPGLAS